MLDFLGLSVDEFRWIMLIGVLSGVLAVLNSIRIKLKAIHYMILKDWNERRGLDD